MRKEFAPRGSKFFPYRVESFKEGALCAVQLNNRKLKKLFPLAEMVKNLLDVFCPL